MMDMATDSVIKEWNTKNPNKRTTDIGGVGAKGNSNQGFGVGYQLVKKKVRTAIDKLQKAGYGIMAITHSKEKKVEEKNGATYDQLQLSLSASAGEIFINAADFIVFLTIEREQSGKDVDVKRYMYFRADDFVTAGSRFKNVPDKVEYSPEAFLEVFENAVKSEFENGENIEKIKAQQLKEKEEKAQEFIQKELNSASADELIAQLSAKVKGLTKETKLKVGKAFEEILGTNDFKSVDDVELLQKAIEWMDSNI
jgi:hypothetical protein